jgi:hypothetical protein
MHMGQNEITPAQHERWIQNPVHTSDKKTMRRNFCQEMYVCVYIYIHEFTRGFKNRNSTYSVPQQPLKEKTYTI